MLRALRSTTSRVLRLAAVLATVAQLVIAAAPVAERGAERSAAAHVEDGGTSAHYAHNEASCPACAAQHLLVLGERRAHLLPARPARIAGPVGRPALATSLGLFSSNPSRAPPVVI